MRVVPVDGCTDPGGLRAAVAPIRLANEVCRYDGVDRWIPRCGSLPAEVVVVVATGGSSVNTPVVRGLPVIGNALEMAADPARFFVRCYRQFGPVFRIKVLNKTYTVI